MGSFKKSEIPKDTLKNECVRYKKYKDLKFKIKMKKNFCTAERSDEKKVYKNYIFSTREVYKKQHSIKLHSISFSFDKKESQKADKEISKLIKNIISSTSR